MGGWVPKRGRGTTKWVESALARPDVEELCRVVYGERMPAGPVGSPVGENFFGAEIYLDQDGNIAVEEEWKRGRGPGSKATPTLGGRLFSVSFATRAETDEDEAAWFLRVLEAAQCRVLFAHEQNPSRGGRGWRLVIAVPRRRVRNFLGEVRRGVVIRGWWRRGGRDGAGWSGLVLKRADVERSWRGGRALERVWKRRRVRAWLCAVATAETVIEAHQIAHKLGGETFQETMVMVRCPYEGFWSMWATLLGGDRYPRLEYFADLRGAALDCPQEMRDLALEMLAAGHPYTEIPALVEAVFEVSEN